MALATNIGLGPMADAAKLSYERLAWAAEWHLRTDTLEAATAAVLRHQHDHPFAAAWGDATRSSSDGQRFTVPVASTTARWLPHYFGLQHRGLSIYTWTSDRWASTPPASCRRQCEKPPSPSTASWTTPWDSAPPSTPPTPRAGPDVMFSLYDLIGIQYAPRLRDVGDHKLYRLAPINNCPQAAPLVTGHIDWDLITRHWTTSPASQPP